MSGLPSTDWRAAMGTSASNQASKNYAFQQLQQASGWSVQGGNAVVGIESVSKGMKQLDGAMSGITGSVLKANVAMVALGKVTEPIAKAFGAFDAGFAKSTNVLWEAFGRAGEQFGMGFQPMFEDWATIIDDKTNMARDTGLAQDNLQDISDILFSNEDLMAEYGDLFRQLASDAGFVIATGGVMGEGNISRRRGDPGTKSEELFDIRDLLREIMVTRDSPVPENSEAVDRNTQALLDMIDMIRAGRNQVGGGVDGGDGGDTGVNTILNNIFNPRGGQQINP